MSRKTPSTGATTGARVLVVDDAPGTLEIVQRNLAARGYQVFTAGTLADALGTLESTPVDLVITDLKMPGASGLDLVRHVRQNLSDVEVIVITGYASIPGAVEAVKHGAEEYLAKPFTDEELLAAVQRALEKLRVRRITLAQRPTPAAQELLGDSPAMQRLLRDLPKVAASTATVLITGESGTGKELVARGIHYTGPRAAAPFLPVNCAGIPESLLESELLGFVKGAFTGAVESRAGFFQTADGGTIFLDEIGETSLAMQVRLLRVLQDREIRMVGASRAQKVDVRVIAATNKDLATLVKKGAFREDLYFRLNVINLAVPPLRERGDDVLLFLRHFAAKFAKEVGRAVPRFSDAALQALRSYDWPGNVRELENLVQRLVVMSEGEAIDVPELPPRMRFAVSPTDRVQRTLAEVELDHIRLVLAHVSGNKTRAAEILGLDRKTLREKLKRFGVSDE